MENENHVSDEQTTPPEQTGQEDEVVPRKAHEQIKQDMLKYKDQMRELQQQVKAYEAKVKEAEESKLVQKEEYKTLYEQWKGKAEQLESKNVELLTAFEDDKKYEQIKRAALKAGIRDEALDDLDMLDTSDVIVEKTDQGRINIIGADEFVTRLREKKPFWFRDSQAPKVNGSNGEGARKPKELTASDILKLQKERPDEYKRIMAERLKRKA